MKPYLPIIPGSVSRRTIKNMISDEIEALITSGVLQVGDQLPSERDLATMLNISRETVRRAIQQLKENGILTVSHGRRARISDVRTEKPNVGMMGTSSISGYSIDDVFGARIEIERAVVIDATKHADDAFIGRLEVILEAQEDFLNDPSRFFIGDRSFHVSIYRQCRNRLLSDIAVDLYTYMLEQRQDIMDYTRAKNGFDDHMAILDAIRSRDGARAADGLEFHITRQQKTSRLLAGVGS